MFLFYSKNVPTYIVIDYKFEMLSEVFIVSRKRNMINTFKYICNYL